MADAVLVNGGSIGPGAVYGDSCVFIGVVISSYSTFGKGCTFVDCAFVRGGKNSPHSVVGEGGTMSGGSARWVDFDPTGVWNAVSDQGDTTPPNCVDCVIQAVPAATGAGNYANAQLVNMVGQVSQADWCAAQRANCGTTKPIIIEPAGNGFTIATKGKTLARP